MEKLLCKLIGEFNSYSELVALNRAQQKEGKCGEGTLQWNRGSLNIIEDHLKMVAGELGVKLTYDYMEHDFGCDDWARKLKYITVSLGQAPAGNESQEGGRKQ